MRQNLNEALERFEGVMADLVDALRDAVQAPAGAGEVDDMAFIEEEKAPARAVGDRGINDESMITISGGGNVIYPNSNKN